MYRDNRYSDTRDDGRRSSNYYSYGNTGGRSYQPRSGVSNKFQK